MKKNLVLMALAIILAPAAVEVQAAYGSRQQAVNDDAAYNARQANQETSQEASGCRTCVRKKRTCNKCVAKPVCPKACPKKVCPKKVAAPCRKACPFVSKCLSCEERAKQNANKGAQAEEEEGSMWELPTAQFE